MQVHSSASDQVVLKYLQVLKYLISVCSGSVGDVRLIGVVREEMKVLILLALLVQKYKH